MSELDGKPIQATSEPEVTMSAVKITRDGRRIPIEMHDVEVSPGFIEQIKQAAAKGWQEGKLGEVRSEARKDGNG